MNLKSYFTIFSSFLVIVIFYSCFNFFNADNFTEFEQNTLSFIPGLEFLNTRISYEFFSNSFKIILIGFFFFSIKYLDNFFCFNNNFL